ncbi:MAG: prepilin-type N-terminal cleavage/methylation domain-containing protein [Magnetococcales bacterium]|nr:prepilin-type N-terminal cleavage/methylation domain-containing protein [Magnetococcales bacterium]
MKSPAATAGTRGSSESPQGFSLLELLVAITIVGLMASFMYVDLRFSLGAWKAGEERLNQMGQISSIQEFLRSRLEKTYPQWTINEKEEGSVAFQGRSHRLTFIAPMQTYLGKAPFYDLSLGVIEVKPGRRDLEFLWKPILPLADEEERKPEKAVLLHNIADVEFRYFGLKNVDTEPVWLEEWEGKTKLPFLTSVTVHFPAGDERIWPVLTVAHRIQMDSACKFDIKINTCAGRTTKE